ncbi:MAG: COG4705 family protein [Ktedonobacterales bacterium]
MGTPLPQPQLDTAFGARGTDAQPVHRALQAARKVPEVTIYFWIIKLLTTGMGETTSDYLAHQLNPIIAVAIGGICFVAALVLQFSVRRYVAWIYWLAVVMVAVFGTMVADVLHVVLGIPYVVSATFFAVALAVIFVAWYVSEKTLSIHTINTRRRELFYWATVVATFALGTAVGDMTATTLGLGYFSSGVLFAVLFAVPAVGYRLFGLNEIFAFWFAYIVTRPLGASFADWAGRSHSLGGLGLGTGEVSLGLAIVIAILVGYLTVTRKDIKSYGA